MIDNAKTDELFGQIVGLVRSMHAESGHRGMVGSCSACKSYLDDLAKEPQRLGLDEWPGSSMKFAREYISRETMTDIIMSADVSEVRPHAPEPRMSSTVRAGMWTGSSVIEFEFKGGFVMTVETAEMLRAALDLAIRACRGG